MVVWWKLIVFILDLKQGFNLLTVSHHDIGLHWVSSGLSGDCRPELVCNGLNVIVTEVCVKCVSISFKLVDSY